MYDLNNKQVIQAGLLVSVFSNKHIIKLSLKVVFRRPKVSVTGVNMSDKYNNHCLQASLISNSHFLSQPSTILILNTREDIIQGRQDLCYLMKSISKKEEKYGPHNLYMENRTMQYGHLLFLKKTEERQSSWGPGPGSSALRPSENLHRA